MHFRKTTIGAVAALALVPSAALAATINGGPQGEHLRGTNNADTINGNGGNDRIFGRKGDDNLNGGQGNDRIFGASGNDTINGVQGNDWLNGGAGDDKISGDANGTGDLTSRDRMYGGSGNDTSDGQNGNDLMSGGTGDDTQHGGAGNDKIFANLGQDTTYVDAGTGDDRFHTRDGEVDRVTCGDGNDTALLDNVDVITDATAENPKGSCETVVRHAPRARDAKSEDAQQSPKDALKTS